MSISAVVDRRTHPRSEAGDVLHWKRPGQPEDHKAWTCDKSASGIAFLTVGPDVPDVGDILDLRGPNEAEWDMPAQRVRVTRVKSYDATQMALVGCTVE
jgi:hypothetical protein